MALTVTNSVATFSGQSNLNRTNNNLPKAVERPTPDVKINDSVKVQKTAPELPAPDIKINFSAKGREAALELPAPDVKSKENVKGQDTKLERPAPDVKISVAAKGTDTKLERSAPDAKNNRRTEEPAKPIVSQKQPTRIELQTAISDTKKAVKQVKAGEGALKEINTILLKVRDQVQDIAKNGTADKGKQAINQKDIANALKAIDQIAKSARLANKKPAGKAVGKVDSPPTQDVKVLPSSVNPKAVTTEVKSLTAAQTEPTTSQTPTKVKVLPNELNTKVGANKVALSTAPQTATLTPTDAASPASNSPATNEAETEAVNKSAPVTEQPLARAINFGETLLTQRGIAETGGKAGRQPAAAITNLLPTVAAPAKSLEAPSAKTVDATDSTINNEPSNEESEEKDTNKLSLFFQGGATADQIAQRILDGVRNDAPEDRADDPFRRLYTLNVSDQASAQDSLKILEKVISDTASLRSQLSAFQPDTLASNADTLRANLANFVPAESTIRNTNFATEIASFTKQQVLLQADSTIRGNANQIPQLVADLLRG